MIDKVTSLVEEYHMIARGDTVIAGVSGGADSLCLLLVLQELQKTIPFSLNVVHIEHGIRGKASIDDAVFVEKLCERKGVAYQCFHYDVPRYAGEHGMSEEEAGRALRYQTFSREADKYKKGKVAIAHNQNDQAETMLLNLIRGSSFKGIAGILPVRDRIIRPLLRVSRMEIEAYLREQGETFCIDATNQTLDYARNRIRHQVLPVLAEMNPKMLEHMEQCAEDIRNAEQYLEKKTKELEQSCVSVDENACMHIDKTILDKAEEILADKLIHRVIAIAAGSRKDIARIHVEAVRKLFSMQVGREVKLPYGLKAKRTYKGVVIGVLREQPEEQGIRNLEDCKEFTARTFEKKRKTAEIEKKKYTKWVDYDKIENSLCVRTRQPGDFFILDESGKKQKLKQYFVNEKIPQPLRDELPLVADGSHIIWAVGYRISAYYKVSEETKNILEIHYNGGKEEDE